MTKSEIATRIHENTGLPKKASIDILESAFSLMKTTLETGETLKICGFGSFIVKQKHPRRGRNPQTGETITIDARRILTFKPSHLLRSAINGTTA